jgi:exopolysaccharide biosynthesis polyprenyl glycosylphosphotransferase
LIKTAIPDMSKTPESVPYHTNLSPWKHYEKVPSRLLILLGDLLVVWFAHTCAYFLRFFYDVFLTAFPVIKGIPPFSIYVEAMPLVLLCWGISIFWQEGYGRVQISATDELIRFLKISVISILLSMSALFLYRENSYSRLVFLLGGALSFSGLFLWRQLMKVTYLAWVRATKRPKRVLVLGTGYLSISLKRMLDRLGDRAVLKKSTASLEEIKRTVARSRIQEVLLTNTKLSAPQTVQLATYCEERGISVRLLPDILEIRMGEVLIDDSLGIPTFQLKPVSLHGSSFFAKRIIDVALASLLLGVMSIPLALVALLIKLTSPNDILFKHQHMSFRERPFDFMKFRTMVKNADDFLEDLKKKSDRSGPVFKMKNDPRITPIGRFLRRYSVDEVPQFLNVLRGEMSLVGPRPQVLWEAQAYDDWARKRLNVLPGITGLWQVSGRAELTYQEMIDLDIFYIEHWSPGLDFKILAKTLPAIIMGKGAY